MFGDSLLCQVGSPRLLTRHRWDYWCHSCTMYVLCLLANLRRGPCSHSLHSTTRSLWVKERSTCWWEEIVGGTFTPQDWLDNFRMSHQTLLYLCNELRSSIERTDTVMRRAVSVERRVALTLWFLATNSDYRTIGHLFGVSKATVYMFGYKGCVCGHHQCSSPKIHQDADL